MSDHDPAPKAIRLEVLLSLLQEGALDIQGLLPEGSNYTFLCRVTDQTDADLEVYAVYKPTRGEQPLWDFPEATLAYREVAAFVVSEALGWDFVPPTVYRTEGPHGAGSLQFFVHTEPDCHYFTLSKEAKAKHLPRVALFDIIINNADRKGGHILKDTQDKLWLIDHGICFNAQPKLRTVVWDFTGEPIPDPMLAEIAAFRKKLDEEKALKSALNALLASDEVTALRRRTDRLLANKRFPEPGPGRNYPWPPL